MRRFVPSVTIAGLCALGLVAGCTEESGGAAPGSSSTTTFDTSTGSGVLACAGNSPDGICTLRAEGGDSCECVDCAHAAGCTGKCKDDGTCDTAGDEDCSCKDCYFKIEECGGSTTTTTTSSESTSSAGGSGGTTTSAGGAAGAGGTPP